MRRLILLFCLCLPVFAGAQTVVDYVKKLNEQTGIRAESNYEWEAKPNVDSLKKLVTKKDATIIKDNRIIEFTTNYTAGRYELYYMKHFLVYINSDKAIEQFNTIALPQHDVEEIVSIKARTISPSGKITNLDRNVDFKMIKNYENSGPFVIFAMQQVEIGSYIEYLYTFRKSFAAGGTEYYRSTHPVLEAEVAFYCSETDFSFSFLKCNADFVNLNTEVLQLGKKMHKFGTDLPGRTEEQYAANEAATPRIEYRLNKKADGEFSEKVYWGRIGEGLWGYLTTLPKSEYKVCKKLCKKIIPGNATPEEKIRIIENYLKKNIQFEKNPSDEKYSLPSTVVAKKTGSATGIMRMYLCMSRYAGVPCRAVATLSRMDKTFDPDFASFSFLRDYVVYFPDQDKYLSPLDYSLRYGFIEEELTCQKGLFMGTMTPDGPVYNFDLKSIVCHTWEQNLNNIDATARFDLDAGVVNVSYQHTYTGFEASPMQNYKLVISGEKDQADFENRVLKNYSGKNEPKNIVVTGNKEADIGKNPLVMKMDYASEQLLEKAGKKYLFHVGDLIGPQSQLYRDTLERMCWIENNHNRAYIRKLIVEIPEGYSITNPDAVNFEVHHGRDKSQTTQFVSYYKIEGNKMIIDIKETYEAIRYPKEDYEPFRKVINAAADFNKVVLYLEKK